MIPGALTFVEVVDGTLVHDRGTCYNRKLVKFVYVMKAEWAVCVNYGYVKTILKGNCAH